MDENPGLCEAGRKCAEETSPHAFAEIEREAIYRAIRERRDMRHFVPGPIDPDCLERLLWAAHHAPSVGYMQPWRFVRIRDPRLRDQIHALVEEERLVTARALGEREDSFMRLKVEGIREAGEVIVAALCDGREKAVFGRRTLPEMDVASLACAVQNMWLAARAEGLGLGWVSIFDPDKLASLLSMPVGARPLAVLCIGHVEAFYPKPMLESAGWAERKPLTAVCFENRWGEQGD